MNQSQQKSLSHAIAKVDLILKYVIQIENEMRINDSFDKKNPLTQNVYKRMYGMLVHVLVSLIKYVKLIYK